MSCLCRTLLAFVAVSCTLSRIHAHGQAPQRLDRIKDLMCVFLLSGMQKEDLDVNMLTKLQRHNVNIGDMSNKELLQECTRIKHTEKTHNNSSPITTATVKDNLTLDEKIYLLINKTNSKNETSDKKENKSVIDYVDGQPDIQSVLSFWHNMKAKRSNITGLLPKKIEHFTETSKKISEQKNKRNIQYNSNAKETDNIQKLLTKYLLRDIHNVTSKSTTVRTNTETEKDLKDSNFHQIFRNDINRRIIENNIGTDNNAFNSALMLYNQIVNMHGKAGEEITTTPALTTKPCINKTSLDELLTFLNIYKTMNTEQTTIKNTEPTNTVKESNLKRDILNENPTTVRDDIKKENIPQNIIKEIATNVKNMVLKELHKEVKATVFPTTVGTVTTYKLTEKATPEMKHNIEEVILSKFLDLFKEIKSMKQSSIVISEPKKHEDITRIPELKSEKIQIQLPVGEEYDMVPPVQIYNNIKNKKPIMYNFSPQVHKLRTFIKPKPVQAIPPPRRLITIQTNNMEIPPLGIPIDMPENPINQNIVVTTAQYRIGENKGNLRSVKVEPSSSFNDYVPKEKYVAKPNTKDFNTNFNQNYPNIQSSVKKNDRANIERHNKKNYQERYKQFDDLLVVNSPIQRYHEKLENGESFADPPSYKQRNIDRIDCCNEKYAYSQQMVQCCNSKIAARQQKQINKAKKQSMYDAHYNNFLKSQKKVNDMLEKILASKSNSRIQAPGVEIA